MTHEIAEQIPTFIEQYGWAFTKESDSCWHSGWQSDRRAYPLTIELCETWIRFVVRPLIKLDIDWLQWPDVMRYILDLNSNCRLVRLGIDEQRHLSLSMDALTRDFSFEHFSDCVSIVGYYAEQLFDTVLAHIMQQGILPGYRTGLLV